MDFVVFLTFISSIQRDKSPIPLFLSVIQFVRGKNQRRKNFRERKFAFIHFFFGKLEEICIICKRIFARSDYSGVKFSYVLIVFIFNSDFRARFSICLPPLCETPELYNTKEFPLFWGNMLSDKSVRGWTA